MNHPFSNYNEDQEFCAGLPFTGYRELEIQEVNELRAQSTKTVFSIAFLLLLNPMFVLFAFILMWYSERANYGTPYLDNTISIIFILVLFIGIPVVILLIRDFYNRYCTYKCTITNKKVRCFEGIVNSEDWTDFTISKLAKKGLISDNQSNPIQIELLFKKDILYSINGQKTKKWFPIDISQAALKLPGVPYYNVPTEWKNTENTGDLERRRLAQGEKEELLFYAGENRRRYWYLLLVCYCSLILRELYDFIGFATRASTYIAVAGALSLLLLGAYKIRSTSKQLIDDAENGWALLYTPEMGKDDPKTPYSLPTEFLMFSDLVWAINGKPAAWRHKNKNRD